LLELNLAIQVERRDSAIGSSELWERFWI